MGNTDFISLGAMLESMRNSAYTLPTAISELIDNAIDANAQKIHVLHETEPRDMRGKNAFVLSRIAVVDNGVGMNRELLQQCLVLGGTSGEKRSNCIGRFHMGLVLSGLSVARRIEVYSRSCADAPFLWTYIDLDEIQAGTMKTVPTPVEKSPAHAYKQYLAFSAGTVVVLAGCDRVNYDRTRNRETPASEQLKGIRTHVGRTFRKYIHSGLQITMPINTRDNPAVFLHDPLYLMGPTIYDTKTEMDAKAEQRLYVRLAMPVPGATDETADVTVRISLLPREWRLNPNGDVNNFGKTRKIIENEGISILRAGREVAYKNIPNLIGERRAARFQDIDRWWGCEISFPPSLDDTFQVGFSKLDVEPVQAVRDKLRNTIAPVIDSLRQEIMRDLRNEAHGKEHDVSVFHHAEQKMAASASSGTLRLSNSASEIDRIASEIISIYENTEIAKQSLKTELENKPFIIKPVEFPQNILIEPEYIGDRLLLKINVKHPFYRKVLEPLLTSGDDILADSGLEQETWRKEVGDALLLMLLSLGKASSKTASQPKDDMVSCGMYGQFLESWGKTLAAIFHELG